MINKVVLTRFLFVTVGGQLKVEQDKAYKLVIKVVSIYEKRLVYSSISCQVLRSCDNVSIYYFSFFNFKHCQIPFVVSCN